MRIRRVVCILFYCCVSAKVTKGTVEGAAKVEKGPFPVFYLELFPFFSKYEIRQFIARDRHKYSVQIFNAKF